MCITNQLQHQGRLMLHLGRLRRQNSYRFWQNSPMLWLLPLMMVYAASVDSQDTVLSTVARISLRAHHVLLLVEGRAVESILLGTLLPDHRLINLFVSTMSRWKKLDRTPTL